MELGIVTCKRKERDIWTEYQETLVCLLTLNLNHKTVDKRLLRLELVLFFLLREKPVEDPKSTHSGSTSCHGLGSFSGKNGAAHSLTSTSIP